MDSRERVLFDDGKHKCIMFSFDDESHKDSFLSVNQYLIVQNGDGVLIDPGSEAVFDEVYDAISRYIEIDNLKFIFLSHQDPDVAGSIAQWSVSSKAKFIMSELWVRFMSHYGFMEMNRVMSLPDHGGKIKFGKDFLKFVPAHFLHSPGNFSIYDSHSKIVFSGDIGAAIVTTPQGYKSVTNFKEHQKYLEDFHKRYMGSNKACAKWASSIRKLDVDIIAPQHGLVFDSKNSKLFLDWIQEFKCGNDYIDELY